jgi:beta-mannanase
MRRFLTTRVTPMVLLVATLSLLVYQHGLVGTSHAVDDRRPVAATHARLELGVATAPLARNWWKPWGAADLKTVDQFERDAGAHARIVSWYADWQHNAPPLRSQLSAIAQRGSIPEITWEPWDASKGLYSSQPNYRLRNIIAGRFDRYIGSWARALAAWHHPVRLRFAQEMDGNWFPWSDYGNGNRPGEFVQAWRHVHRIFDRAGADNVKWVWSPAFARSGATFPGAASVDMLAATCQNAGKRLFARGWQSFSQNCGKAIGRLHALAPTKPIQLAEASSAETGGSKARWISGMFAYLKHHPEVTSVIWFNIRKEADWRIESSRSAKRAFAAGLRSMDLSGPERHRPDSSATSLR